MASDKGSFKDGMDERLVEVRDSVLLQGEGIVAQAEADQGQAIVLTSFRVIVIKVGLTATGTMNGQITNAYPLEKITAVNVRKGPMGAVIQIVTEEKEQAEPGAPPGNVVIFSDPRKAITCEAIAAEIEQLLGKPVEKIGPPAKESKIAEEPAEEEPVIKQVPPKSGKAKKVAPQIDSVWEKDNFTPMTEEISSPEPELTPEPVQEPAIEFELAQEPESKPEPESEPVPEFELPAAEAAQTDIPSIPDMPKGRAKRSLADEIYDEVTGANPPEPAPEPKRARKSAPTQEQPVAAAKFEPPADQPSGENKSEEKAADTYRPNPRLPKPVAKRGGNKKALALIGGLLAVALAGIAIIGPMKMAGNDDSTLKINIVDATSNKKALINQYSLVIKYRAAVEEIVKPNEQAAAAFKGAVSSGNKAAILAAANQDYSDKAWQKLNELEAPAGLAGAKENLAAGMFIHKNAVANIESSLQSSTNIDTRIETNRLNEADALVKRGLDAISEMVTKLEDQMGKAKSRKPTP